MSKKKLPPTVVLESVFVRDHQRRLRLVIELLEQQARRQHTPPTHSQSPSQPKTMRALTDTQNNSGGEG